MPFKIIRNDITKMNTEAIVNTANDHAAVGTGCDSAVYEAAGYQELLEYRKKHIGFVEEGGAFITPGFQLQAKYIIHAVSPYYVDGKHGEEEKLHILERNSGPEFPPELLCQQHYCGGASKHIGLQNISRRLNLLYGEKAEMRIVSGENLLTSVEIILPRSSQDEEKKYDENNDCR